MLDDVSVLVTGGTGYIGSHLVLELLAAGCRVVVVDDLSTGRREAVADDALFVEGDAGDDALVRGLIAKHRVAAVIHMAALAVVPESIERPLDYYLNNTAKSRNLIAACVDVGVRYFVFSSTAAVYGIPSSLPVSEDGPTEPINPYGWSKLMTERMLRDIANAADFRYVALRYFNVAGADPAGRTGQSTAEATHLVKVASQTVVGLRDHIEIFGEDYPTPDGTCVRDYIHVTDIAAAHVDALVHLQRHNENLTLNCGYGHGYSVREVLRAVEREVGRSLDVRSAPRRPGDPPELVADASKIKDILGWRPRHDDLDLIVRTAIAWERKLAKEGKEE